MTGPRHIEMPSSLHVFGRLFDICKPLLVHLANLETRSLAEDLERYQIRSPVYITGLARSGSTILLEIIASHPDTGSHQYNDFPPLFIPCLWDWFLKRALKSGNNTPVERAHKDGILVTPESPEAMEEIIWMHFFPDAHDSSRNNILDENTVNSKFESFYKDHLQKILLVRNKPRYLSKGNYNFTRFSYIQKLFSDAKFIVPIRNPVMHLASLLKQHKLFCTEETRDPRILKHMQRVGHYEFGLDLRLINTSDSEEIREIRRLIDNGEEIRGWARYWSHIYGYIFNAIENNEALENSVLVVRYEDLCNEPENTLTGIFNHCDLELEESFLQTSAKRLVFPSYYKAGFSEDEVTIIREETSTVAKLYHY